MCQLYQCCFTDIQYCLSIMTARCFYLCGVNDTCDTLVFLFLGKAGLPDPELLVEKLLKRRTFRPDPQGTNLMFAFFAQHFTHQFFKTYNRMGLGFTKALAHGVRQFTVICKYNTCMTFYYPEGAENGSLGNTVWEFQMLKKYLKALEHVLARHNKVYHISSNMFSLFIFYLVIFYVCYLFVNSCQSLII